MLWQDKPSGGWYLERNVLRGEIPMPHLAPLRGTEDEAKGQTPGIQGAML